MEPQFRKHFSEITDLGSLVIKSRAIRKSAQIDRRFSCNHFYQLSNSHTSRDRVRIYNNIGSDPIFCKRHIFFWNHKTHCTFLSRARRHLISNRRNTYFPNTYFCNTLTFFSVCNKRFIDHSQLSLLWSD